jgi:sRNA-binding protein
MTIPSHNRRRAAEVRRILTERFPLAFMPKGASKPPLKVGTYGDVRVAAPDLTSKDVRLALNDYTGGATYLRNVIVGAVRIDLNGESAGTVTEDQAAHAAGRLKRFERWAASQAKKVSP